jgi:hypothetical protein
MQLARLFFVPAFGSRIMITTRQGGNSVPSLRTGELLSQHQLKCRGCERILRIPFHERNELLNEGHCRHTIRHANLEPLYVPCHCERNVTRPLARANAVSGDTTKAKSAYLDFLALWKDADAYIPILKEAKAEYAKIH